MNKNKAITVLGARLEEIKLFMKYASQTTITAQMVERDEVGKYINSELRNAREIAIKYGINGGWIDDQLTLLEHSWTNYEKLVTRQLEQAKMR